MKEYVTHHDLGRNEDGEDIQIEVVVQYTISGEDGDGTRIVTILSTTDEESDEIELSDAEKGEIVTAILAQHSDATAEEVDGDDADDGPEEPEDEPDADDEPVEEEPAPEVKD